MEQVGTGVGQGIDGVAHAVDQARLVKGLLVEQGLEVVAHLVLVLPVPDGLLHVLKHLHHLDVGAAVPGALQGGQGGRHAGVGIGTGGGDHMGGKGGVVAAAVLGMEGQTDIQHMGLPEGIGGVGPQQGEDILRRGQLRPGGVDIQAAAALVVPGLIAVDAEHGEQGDELDALAHHIGQGDVVGPVVVGGQVEHAAGQGVHNVVAGGLEDDIPHKVIGQGAVVGQLLGEAVQLLLGGQLAQQQQVGGLLKAEAALLQGAGHQILHIYAPVVQLALAGQLLAVYHLLGNNIGDLGEAGKHALAVQVTQAPFHIILYVIARVDPAVFLRHARQGLDLRRNVAIVGIACHKKPPFSSLTGESAPLSFGSLLTIMPCKCYHNMNRLGFFV